MPAATCPICDKSAQYETLSSGWRVCLDKGCGYAYQVNGEGLLIGWATTNRSHPHGIYTVDTIRRTRASSQGPVAGSRRNSTL